jgi:competence protein ComEC
MAGPEQAGSRAESSRTKASRAKAWAADLDAARRRAGLIAPDWLAGHTSHLRELLSQWAQVELAPGRLLPWLAVAFGLGIALYFSAEREPAWWAASALACLGVVGAVLARRRPAAFPLALGLAAIASGFAVATLTTLRTTHPVLERRAWSAAVTGFVETREERARSDRIVVHVTQIDARRMGVKPDRVRVAVRKGTAPEVGAFVAFKANLSPPLAPLRPGGYDFARGMYFQRIGASGYVLGRIRSEPAPQVPDLRLRALAAIDHLREAINRRIHAALPGDRGSIASALITGKRNEISEPVREALYISSLAHVLAISGYHMAVVAGLAFFAIRAGLALSPSLASRRPIKKWAAGVALGAAAFYLVLSGASVSTQRAFIMVTLVLIGVMADRPALTFRTLTIAAFGVLLLSPQAVVHPSFQMSFAAALALIAAYQYGVASGGVWRADADSSLSQRAALWGGREIAALLLASVVAGLATTPYAAFHFHRVAPYGVLANLLAMPVVSAWVMPMGILAVLALPFGFDAPIWRLMGEGIGWMTDVALWVTSLPGAVGHMPAFGTGPLLVGTFGLLLLCLLRTPLRLSGAVLAVIAAAWALATPRPDVLVAGDGRVAAIRAGDGRLSFLASGRDSFVVKEWLAADGDARGPKDASLREGVACDAIGCVGRLRDGRLATVAFKAEAFVEDCARAAVVISQRSAPIACAARLVDRNAWRERGAIALHWDGARFVERAARPPGTDRPWARSLRDTPAAAPARGARDATPRGTDLEADD